MPAVVQVPPSPATVKLPLVFCSVMPFAVPPVDVTLVSEMLKGVVLLARVISTAVAPLVLIAPLVRGYGVAVVGCQQAALICIG